MKRFALMATLFAALVLVVPTTGAADAVKSQNFTLTCGTETFDVVVPAGGGTPVGQFTGSTSVAILHGAEFDGQRVFTPGFTEDELTRCTAVEKVTGRTFTAFVLITPRR